MGSTDWKLPDHQKIAKNKVVGLVVLDGWGEYKDDQYNCIHTAETPFMDSLKKVPLFSFSISLLLILPKNIACI